MQGIPPNAGDIKLPNFGEIASNSYLDHVTLIPLRALSVEDLTDQV